MDPVTLSLIAGGIQTGVGAIQRQAAAKRRRNALRDMKYDIPSAVTEQVQNARAKASQSGLPGEDITRSRLESDLARQTAKGESVSSSSSDVLGMYAKMFGQKSDIEQQILEKGAQYKSMNELELNKALGLMAEAEGQQFYYNRFVPFMSEMGYASEQAQGGAANIAGGLQTAYQGWMNNWMMDQYKELYGQGGVDKVDMATDFTRKKLGNNASQWMNQSIPAAGLNVDRSELSPWVDPEQRFLGSHPDRDKIKYGY